MKRFAYLSFGIMCTAITALTAAQFETPAAVAQGYSPVVSYEIDVTPNSTHHYAILENGDIYTRHAAPGATFNYPSEYVGNIFGDGTVPTEQKTLGNIKNEFKGKKD